MIECMNWDYECPHLNEDAETDCEFYHYDEYTDKYCCINDEMYEWNLKRLEQERKEK
jgi:hypothetical protein